MERENQLINLGFKKSKDEQSYCLGSNCIPKYKIETYFDKAWQEVVTKVIRDEYNRLNSQLREETYPKMGKRINEERVNELKLKIEALNQ